MTIRLAHVWSSDVGIPASIPFCAPLLARGWEITMITPDGPHVAGAAAAGMRWLPLNLERRMRLGSDVRGTVQLAGYLRGPAFNIVHTHNIKVGHIARVVAAALRVPIVVHTLHGLAYGMDTPRLKRTLHAALERIASARCDRVLSQSEEDRETVIATHAVRPDQIEVIGNGIDLTRFDPATHPPERRAATRAALGVEADQVLFLSAGRLVREKGFVELFEAAVTARAADPRIRVAVAGPLDDDKADALDTATLDRARAGGVLILGSRPDMPELYAAADVVVLASWREGMPRVLMEGAATGKPLIASDARGCREIVRPPEGGLRFPVRDADALAQAMRTMAADPDLRSRIGAENARIARERYDVNEAVRRVVAAYDRLISRKLAI